MGFSSGNSGGVQGEINVTPLVDVVLVLLIIFMVVTPLLQVGLPADIPKAPDEEVEVPPDLREQVVISVKEDGKIFLNKDEITLEALVERVRAIMLKRPADEKIAFISGTDDRAFGEIVHVMDAIRGAGVKRIGLIDPI